MAEDEMAMVVFEAGNVDMVFRPRIAGGRSMGNGDVRRMLQNPIETPMLPVRKVSCGFVGITESLVW